MKLRDLQLKLTSRLVPSAYPECHLAPNNTKAIGSRFGDVILDFQSTRSIVNERLCRYAFYLYHSVLTDHNTEVYFKITAKLGKMISGNLNKLISKSPLSSLTCYYMSR